MITFIVATRHIDGKLVWGWRPFAAWPFDRNLSSEEVIQDWVR